jgi:hypothetical protein
LVVEPRDLVRISGGVYSRVFDGSARGVDDGVKIDAVSRIGSDYLLSLDTVDSLAGLVTHPGDVVRFDGSVFSLYFDASSSFVPDGLNLDAVHYVSQYGTLYVSFDETSRIAGNPLADEDVMEYKPSLGWLGRVFDGSAEHTGWAVADLDAVTVPGEPVSDEVFADDFESGSTSGWSSTVP